MKVVCETLTLITYREPCAVLYRLIVNDIIASCPVYLVFSCIDEKMTSGLTQAIAEIERKTREIIGLGGSHLTYDYAQSDATNTWI